MPPVVDARLFPLDLAMMSFHTVVTLSRHAMLHTVCFVLWHVGCLALLVGLFVAVSDLFFASLAQRPRRFVF